MSTTLFLLKTMESLENGLQPYSMRTIQLVSWQSCHSVYADVWYERALSEREHYDVTLNQTSKILLMNQDGKQGIKLPVFFKGSFTPTAMTLAILFENKGVA